MDVSTFLSAASFWVPERDADPSRRSAFYPVACWLVDAARPLAAATLGLQRLDLDCAIREAIQRLGLETSSATVEPTPAPPEHIIGRFADRSIDLIHVSDVAGADLLQRDLEAWRRKLSERAVLLLSRTNVAEEDGGARGFFRELARRHPSFEFTHDDGLGLVALGEAPPDRVRALFDADGTPALRDQIRLAYARLGRSVVATVGEAPAILDLGGPLAIAAEDHLLREENELLRAENERLATRVNRLDQAHRSLNRETAALRHENPGLRRHAASVQHQHALAIEQLDELRGSAAVALVEKGRRLRGRYFPQTRLHGRCLELIIRFARVSIQVGPRAAIGKAARKVWRKAGLPSGGLSLLARRPGSTPVYRSIDPTGGKPGFEDLPWTRPDDRPGGGAGARPALKVLLVSHAACRTGAPLCLLRLSQELAKIPGVECWTVLKNGGELAPQFAKHAPTLELATLAAQGVNRADAPDAIASLFREFAPNGVAICNTMAVSEFHEALEARKVPVLSWVHELPTFIDILGGRAAIDRIQRASRRTIVPADVVRAALIDRFDFDPARIQTVRYGLDAGTRGLSREAMRARVRDELKLPADARIVLGCGTIDLRKGADLFAQLGRTFLREVAPAELAERTYFLWIGNPVDPNFRKWVLHDVDNAGLSDRVRFLGPRKDMAPYFLAADVFALTSREDPCPFANLEAMESALAVVAFQGSGGAPEVLGDGGIAVPYLDVAAMAEAARDLLGDDPRRLAMGESGQTAIRRHFTWPRFMAEFRRIMEADYGLGATTAPTVSVIVPNYRHAPYLEARLRSVFEQTVPPLEIIFLDDASPDDSVEVARRLALESPVPMRLVVNDRNGGSTFRQWLKGLELARGDLVWIAESDDCAHPEFLERLLPEFHDPEVLLAYCQSALIGSDDRILVRNFLGHTDDISPSRWRSRYSAPAADEAEIALSRKNTIPNASAVLFRRQGEIDYAEELVGLRFAGDWLFYAMRIRGGKIAFAPEVLNYYRRHEMTVSHQSFKTDTHAEETLHVRIRVFETFGVSANAIGRGLGQTFLEHAVLNRRFGLKRQPLTLNGRAATAKLLDRARAAFDRQTPARGELKVLFILDAVPGGLDELSSVHLMNALARDHRVFLCVASPLALGENPTIAELNDRVVPIEGALGALPWSAGGAERGLRAEVLKELIRFHQIDVIHSRFGEADRLAAELNVDLNLPWFVHMNMDNGGWLADDSTSAEAVATISGVFHEGADARRLAETRPELAGKRWVRLLDGFSADPPSRPRSPIRKRDGEFLLYLVTDEANAPADSQTAMAAVRLVNRLSRELREGRRVRLVLPGEPSAASAVDELALMSQCDAAVAPHAGEACRVSSRIAALLARNVPIIAPDKGAIHDMLSSESPRAGLDVATDGRPTLAADRVAAAILRQLREPGARRARGGDAGRLFDARFRVDHAAAVCAEAYLHARDFLVFAREHRPTTALEGRAARESA